MGYLIGFVLNGFAGAVVLWGAIKLVDRRNRKNKISTAFIIGVFLGLLGMVPFLPGLGLLVLAYFLLNYYDLGIPEIMAVLFILIGVTVGIGLLQIQLAGR